MQPKQASPLSSAGLAAHLGCHAPTRRPLGFCCAALLAAGSLQAQAPQKDPIDREAGFIEFLLNQNLVPFAQLAMKELSEAHPNEKDRIQVAEATLLLRTGKVKEVEDMLATRTLESDTKGQAILLQLAMTYDALGRGEEAMAQYSRFMKLNEGKEIEDPDILRYFASAGLRLAAIQQDAKQFDEASKTLRAVVRAVEGEGLKRKFSVLAVQNTIDHALTLPAADRKTRLQDASNAAKDVLYGGQDNYFYIAIAQLAYVQYLEGDEKAAMKSLEDNRAAAQQLEDLMDKEGIPKSEYPRAAMRYFEGLIQFQDAKRSQESGREPEARKLASQALGNFYNAFLLYDGNDYANRSALLFEEVKAWVKETYGREPKMNMDARATGLIFRRQLDLAQALLRSGKNEEAETLLLRALHQYPVTPYTLQALDVLGRIWIAQNRDWELLALAEYAAHMFPDVPEAATLLKRIGNKMVMDKNTYGTEVLFSAFGRKFPGDPVAADRLLMVGKQAADRGDQARAIELYGQLLAIYPGSKQATQVLNLRAAEALKAENYEAAIEAFQQVREQAPPGFNRAQASMGIASALLRMDGPEKQKEALTTLSTLRKELDPSLPDNVYYRGADAEKSEELLRTVRLLQAQVLLRRARDENSDKLREQAAGELNAFLAEYPRAEQAPEVMYNLGRLQLQQKNTAAAQATFEKLSREFPNSDAGRDALYSLVRAALEEGQVEVARQSVARMIEQPDSYDLEKIYQVGMLMMENERWQEAADCLAIVNKNPRTQVDEGLRQRTLFNLGRAALGAGRSEEAIEGLSRFLKDFPTSALVVDAGIALSDACLSLNPPRIDDARQALGAAGRIQQALAAANRDKPDSRHKIDQTKLDVATARLNLADGQTGAALLNLYKASFATAESPEHAALIRTAIRLGVDKARELAEAGETKRWTLVRELTDQYLRNFPMDRDASEFRALNIRAISLAPQN